MLSHKVKVMWRSEIMINESDMTVVAAGYRMGVLTECYSESLLGACALVMGTAVSFTVLNL